MFHFPRIRCSTSPDARRCRADARTCGGNASRSAAGWEGRRQNRRHMYVQRGTRSAQTSAKQRCHPRIRIRAVCRHASQGSGRTTVRRKQRCHPRIRIRAVCPYASLEERPDGVRRMPGGRGVPFTRCMVFLPPSLAPPLRGTGTRAGVSRSCVVRCALSAGCLAWRNTYGRVGGRPIGSLTPFVSARLASRLRRRAGRRRRRPSRTGRTTSPRSSSSFNRQLQESPSLRAGGRRAARRPERRDAARRPSGLRRPRGAGPRAGRLRR